MGDELYELIVETRTDFVFVLAQDGACVFANGAARRELGIVVGGDVWSVIHDDDRDAARLNFSRVIAGEELSFCYRVRGGRAGWRWLEIFANRVRHADAPCAVAIARDVTEQKRASQGEALQLAVSRILAESVDEEAVELTLLEVVCSGVGCEVGELWIFDDDARALRCKVQWRSHGLDAADFATVTRTIAFDPGVGLPGSVWARNEPVCIADLAADSQFLRGREAARAGLHSAIGCPIVHRDRLLGVLVTLTSATLDPSRDTFDLLAAIASQIAQFMARHRAEAGLLAHYRTSLHEKEMLIREIHHRVKNNLQLVNSLLSLQSEQLAPSFPAVERVFAETQARIQTMATIHDTLCRNSTAVSYVELAPHVETICAQVYRVFAIDPGRIALELDIESAQIGLDVALSCGLIINELVANALKHAFPETRRGTICVRLATAPDHLALTVRDDGVGLPASLDPLASDTLGLTLVRDLTEQLRASLTIDRTVGTSFSFAVPRAVEAA